MAGDWLKWTKGLTTKREVIAIASTLGIDRKIVAATLMEIWEWADDNTIDGHVSGVTKEYIDSHSQLDGIADAMLSVGWLDTSGDGIKFPKFDRHNGKSAKTRALASDRKRRQRSGVTENSREGRDNNVTREEKKREEKKNPVTGGRDLDSCSQNSIQARPRDGSLAAIDIETLKDDSKLAAWFKDAVACTPPPGKLQDTDRDLQFVFSAAVRALKHGKNKVRMFVALVRDDQRDKISNSDDDEAEKRLLNLERKPTASPINVLLQSPDTDRNLVRDPQMEIKKLKATA